MLFEAGRGEGEPPGGDSPKRKDWHEVIYYDMILADGTRRIAAGEALNLALICNLHNLLLAGDRGKDKQPGSFRDTQVYVEASGRYIPPPPEDLSRCLASLENSLVHSQDYDPLVRAHLAHYQFEAFIPSKTETAGLDAFCFPCRFSSGCDTRTRGCT